MQIFKTVVTDHPQDVAEQLAPAFGLPPEVMLGAPFFQIGTVEQITENIQAMRERWGISYVLFQTDGIVPMGPGGRSADRHLTSDVRSRSYLD